LQALQWTPPQSIDERNLDIKVIDL
jgi:hypothetical protein